MTQTSHPYSLKRDEHLKSRKAIGAVFQRSCEVRANPIRLIYTAEKADTFSFEVGFAAPIYKKFSAVLVIPSQGLEVGRIHPEQEIVREHGVIVLEGAGHLALAHSCHIQPDGVHTFDVRHGHEPEWSDLPCGHDNGDVDGDGQVGIGDIVAITNVMAGINKDPLTAARADVNGDGSVGIGDIVAVTNIMAGIK